MQDIHILDFSHTNPAWQVPHLQNTAAAVQMATTAEDQLALIQAQQLGGVVLDAATQQQQLAQLMPKDGLPVPQDTAVVGDAGGAVVGGFLVGSTAALPTPQLWIQQPIPQPILEAEYETASDATLDADLGEPGEVVSSVRQE